MKLFYIDPQSYNNLADYDKYLLENINIEKEYFCSTQLPFAEVNYAKVNKVFSYNKYKGIKKIISYIKSVLILFFRVKKERPDIIHYQWFKIPFFDLYILKKIKKHFPLVKIVHTAHNTLPHDSGAKYIKIYKKIYESVDNIIVHADDTKMELVKMFGINGDKVSVIPHGFLPRTKKMDYVKDSNKITFSFIGFLSDYKGLDLLINAWVNNDNILNNKGCRLIIAGAGELDCLKLIPNDKNIIVENYFHSDDELTKIIAETDIAILPYRKISQSGVLLTYLAEHIPVIVSNIGGLIQPFEIGTVGWVMEKLSTEELEKLLLEVINNRSLLDNITDDKALWSKIDQFYDWNRIGYITEELYKRIKGSDIDEFRK